MSGPPSHRQAPPPPPSPPTYAHTPNAEKYVLEADAMRRRQLRSALIHGSGRTWREQPRTWPAVVVGLIAVALVCGGLTVKDAFQKEKASKAAEAAKQARAEREQREQQEAAERAATPTPSPGPTVPTASTSPSTPSTSVPVPAPTD